MRNVDVCDDKGGIQFRPAGEADFLAICQMIESEQELFLVYPSGSFPLTVQQLQELARKREKLTVLVKEGMIIGFANLYQHQPGEFAYIGNVIVAKAFRGQGLGRALVNYMSRLAFDELELSEVRISVFSDNALALLLYAELGFCPYGLEPRVSPSGERVALIHLRRLAD